MGAKIFPDSPYWLPEYWDKRAEFEDQKNDPMGYGTGEHPDDPWIETNSGLVFHLLNPTPTEVEIEDIAHALSQVCRFGGHTKHFYSVAEHSYHVSYLTNHKLSGLLHDASEAYVADIVSPLKPHLTSYREIESRIMKAILYKFGLAYPIHKEVKDADVAQLKTEARHLLPSKGKSWVKNYHSNITHGRVPRCWSPAEAKMRFLDRFEELTKT